MRGVDTNVLVRFLTGDDPEQVEIVKDLFARGEAEHQRFNVSSIVLCELVWVLRSQYRLRRGEICSMLDSLFEAGVLEIQEKDLARRALEEFKKGPADFADYLIGWHNRRAGCLDTLTFDGDLEGNSRFTILS